MQFNVASLLKEHTGAMREYIIDDEVRIDDEEHHVSGRARLDLGAVEDLAVAAAELGPGGDGGGDGVVAHAVQVRARCH